MNSSKEERWMLKDNIWVDSQGYQGNIRVQFHGEPHEAIHSTSTLIPSKY